MMHRYSSRITSILSLVIPLALAVSVSGCLLFGLGAAAGAAVGGCHLLDQNDDERVTEAEFSAGLYDAWDTNNNNRLTEAEFDAGVNERNRYAGWSGEFDNWDTNNNDELTEAEFRTAVSNRSETEAWIDDECDDLGL